LATVAADAGPAAAAAAADTADAVSAADAAAGAAAAVMILRPLSHSSGTNPAGSGIGTTAVGPVAVPRVTLLRPVCVGLSVTHHLTVSWVTSERRNPDPPAGLAFSISYAGGPITGQRGVR